MGEIRDAVIAHAEACRAAFKAGELRPEWSGGSLSGANLSGADLGMANLRWAVLCDANLDGAIVSYRGERVRIRFEEVRGGSL